VKLVILAEGKLKDRALRQLCDDYLARIRKYARLEEIEVRESAALLRAVSADTTLVALEVTGEAVSSKQLAERLGRWIERGKGVVTFAIGGAEGLPKELVGRAHVRLSLSSLTLPHRLARLLLAEQIYRAFTILRGEPYAREE
jgi:23S rRNA (pseudouridine1915-N3)-methyltransferase